MTVLDQITEGVASRQIYTQGMTLIGLCGFAGCGKDAVAKAMKGYFRLAFADELKARAAHALSVDVAYVESHKPELRDFLVDIGRRARAIDPLVWVRYVHERLRDLRIRDTEGGYDECCYVLSDVRYANEAAWIRELDGEVFYISRNGVGPANNEELHSIKDLQATVRPWLIRNNTTPAAAARDILARLGVSEFNEGKVKA